MSSWQLGLDLVATFLLAAGLLFHYGNWYRHHIIVTLSVLIAWYFSFVIIFVLPLDMSATAYRQCQTQYPVVPLNKSVGEETNSTCQQPNSYVGDAVMTNLWRVVYWTSQCLTWLILPMMQSYTQAGEFSVKGKMKSALMDNIIYYGIYLFICSILLIYLATRPELELDWQKLKAIASSASNSWGLFLLVFMLGYGLVSVPLVLWSSSCKGHSLNQGYFKIAKLSQERNSAEENLEDVLESLQGCIKSEASSKFQKYIETIEMQIPTEFRERMRRRRNNECIPVVDEKVLVKLHRQVKKSVQNHHRVEAQWDDQISNTIQLEDIEKNARSGDTRYKATTVEGDTRFICTPYIEWYWRCKVERLLLKILSVLAGVMSLSVIWSEAVFFNRSPVLSIFAVFLNMAKDDYVTIEAVSTITIAYMAVCAFYTIFKIRIFNFYYLASKHQTDEYSLIFSGMLLCRLTPPLCLNVISVFQLDSHVVQVREEETSYTKVMGHMDVLSLISDGFNIYFPMGILLVSLMTYFKIGARLLSILGFQQFLVDDDITSELVIEGTHLLQREKRRRQRAMESNDRRKYTRSAAQDANQTVENLRGLDDRTSVLISNQRGLYGTPDSSNQPPRDLFDDV